LVYISTNVDPSRYTWVNQHHWYGISYLIGFVCVFLWMNGRPDAALGLTTSRSRTSVLRAGRVLVGGRTFFVINDIISKHDASFYFSSRSFIAVWNGGMAFHGAWSASSSRRGCSFASIRPEVSVLARGRRPPADRHHLSAS